MAGVAVMAGLAFVAGNQSAHALPPAGTDVIDLTAQVSIVSVLGQETIGLTGTITIDRGDPYLDGGVEVVDLEVVALDMSGLSVTGPVTISESPTLTSAGELRSLQGGGSYPASLFLDAYLVAEVPASPSPTVSLQNDVPLHLVPMAGGFEVSVNSWPPAGVTLDSAPDPCVPLLPSEPKQICVTGLSATFAAVPVGGVTELSGLDAAALYAGEPSDNGFPLGYMLAATVASLALASAVWYVGLRVRARPGA